MSVLNRTTVAVSSTGDPATVDIPIPAGWTIASGELLIIVAQSYASGAYATYDPSGWTRLWHVIGGTQDNFMRAAWRKPADGSEAGTNINWQIKDSSLDENVVAHIYHLDAWNTVEVSSEDNTVAEEFVNIPPITPSWEAKAGTIFIPVGQITDSNFSGLSGPTDYVNLLENNQSAVGEASTLVTDYRTAETATEDPDTFSWSGQGTSNAVARIIAIEPADSNPIAGTVEYPEGTPLENVVVSIFTQSSLEDQTTPTFVESVLTDANGEWAMQATYDETLSYKVEYKKFIPEVTGTADSATSSSLTDAGVFTTGQFDDGETVIILTGGTGSGQERRVTGNADTDTVDIDGTWGTTPDGTTTYEVGYMYSDELKFKPPKSSA